MCVTNGGATLFRNLKGDPGPATVAMIVPAFVVATATISNPNGAGTTLPWLFRDLPPPEFLYSSVPFSDNGSQISRTTLRAFVWQPLATGNRIRGGVAASLTFDSFELSNVDSYQRTQTAFGLELGGWGAIRIGPSATISVEAQGILAGGSGTREVQPSSG